MELPIKEEKLQELVDILIQEVDFLIDDKMRETMVDNADDKVKTQVKLGVVKKCLNIDSIDEMLIFLEEFIRECKVVK